VNWDAVGAIGEIVGASAIFVTLIYLAYQIRQARTDASDETRRNRVSGIREIQSWTVMNPEAMAAWTKASGPGWNSLMERVAGELDITKKEAELVVTLGAAWVWTHWAQYRSTQSEVDVEELKNIVSVWYSEPPMSVLIADPSFMAWFDPDFSIWLQETLKEKGAAEADA
jgi:hypothetical protein